ncbi:unnamed protein product, partial [Ectocarpus sp. 4 AP-2014]
MPWYDGHSDDPIADHRDIRVPPTSSSPHRGKQTPDYAFGCDRDCNGNVGGEIFDPPSGDAGGGDGRREWDIEGRYLGGAGGEDDDTAALRLLENVLAKQSKQDRRPSTAHVDLLERGAVLKTRMFGPQSSAARKAFKDTIVACNSLAMSALGRGNTERCRDLLERAFQIASSETRRQRNNNNSDGNCRKEGASGSGGSGNPALQILTLNNTACLHRRLGEPKRALWCLRRAAELGRRSCGSDLLEVTHLNACAVLSELGRHEEALEHARSAVYHGQELEGAGTHAGVAAETWRSQERRSSPSAGVGGSRKTRLATLAVSYYNLAVELEYTHRYEACLRWYGEAVQLARDPDVHNEELLKTFQRSFAGARKKYAPLQLGRSGGAKKGPSTSGAVPIRRDCRDRTSSGGYPSPFRALDRLGDNVPTTSDGGSPASYGGGNANRLGPEVGSGVERGPFSHRRAEWPDFCRAQRQRASDERRSQTRSNHSISSNHRTCATTNGHDDGGAGAVPTSNPEAIYQRDPLLRHRQHNWRGVLQEEIAGRDLDRAVGSGARPRPASGRAAGDPTVRPKLSRKRPASADIVRERDRGVQGRTYFDQIDVIQEVADAPSVVEPTWQQQQQQQQRRRRQQEQLPGVRGGVEMTGPPIASARHVPAVGVEVAETNNGRQQRRRAADSSRRPKSAYPRLEDGGARPGGDGALFGMGDPCSSRRNGNNRSSRVGRIRSLSARASEGLASLAPPLNKASRDRDDGDDQRSGEWEGAKELTATTEVEDNGRVATEGVANDKSSTWRGPSGNATGTMMTSVVEGCDKPSSGIGLSSGQTYRLNSSRSDSQSKRECSVEEEVEAPRETTQTDLPGRRSQAAAAAVAAAAAAAAAAIATAAVTATTTAAAAATTTAAPVATTVAMERKSTKFRRGAPRSSPSRSKKGGSPPGGRQRKKLPGNRTEQNKRREPTPRDNGRDGKLYRIDPDSDGQRQHQRSTLLGCSEPCYHVNNSDPCLDNGRDGKLYVELDNGRDGKLYLETESVDGEPHGNDKVALSPAEWAATVKHDGEQEGELGETRAEKLEGNIVDKVDSIEQREAPGKPGSVETPPPERLLAEAARTIQKAVSGEVLRRRSSGETGTVDGGEGERRKTLPELFLSDRDRSECQALTERGPGREQQGGLTLGTDSVAVPVSEDVGAFADAVAKERRTRAREEINRHVLAASAIRTWIARACLARRLRRRRRVRDDLRVRWEPEIHRIAATRIQALARGAAGRRVRGKAERAAVEIQRVERGRRGRSAANELARKSLDERGASCEDIQRLFRGHQGRQQALKKRQIAWEEDMARQGAAGVLQGAWHRCPSRRRLVQQQQQEQEHTGKKSATESSLEGVVLPSMTSAAGAKHNPSAEEPPRQQLWQGAETSGAVYGLWGAFNSLVATAATRRVVRRAVGRVLFTPAAATLAAFNRGYRSMLSSTLPTSPSSSKRMLTPPDPASFDCALGTKTKLALATRRMAGAVRARTSSILAVRSVAGSLLDGVHGDGERGATAAAAGSGCGGGAAEDDERRGGGTAKTVAEETVSVVLEMAQECLEALSSLHDDNPLAGLSDGAFAERLTMVLSGTLESLVDHLGEMEALNLARGQEAKTSTIIGGDDGSGSFLDGLTHDRDDPSLRRPLVLPAGLLGALASSATASLLSHPDIFELVGQNLSHDEENESGGSVNDRPRSGEWDENGGERSNDEDCFSRLVAEAYCSFLLVSRNVEGRGGGDSNNGDGAKPSQGEISEPGCQQPEKGGEGNISITATRRPQQPSSPSPITLTNGRLQFLRSITELIDRAAEEIVRGMDSCARLGGGKCFDADLRRMTNDLWRLARRGMTPSAAVRDDEDEDAEFKRMTRAAIVIQRCSRRYQAREPR